MGEGYFIDLNGKTEGPFSLADLAALRNAGTINDQTIFASPNDTEWRPLSVLFRPAPSSPPPLPDPVQRKPIASSKQWFCTQCHTIGRPVYKTPGSFVLELVLWLLFCLPGVIYTVWRLTCKTKCCPACHSAAVIRCNSPAARNFVDVV